MPDLIEPASIDLADIDLTPRFVERLANAQNHADYLEAAHESTYRNLAVIALRLAKGDAWGAASMLAQLRAHLDALWEQRKEAAERGVAP